ncbi:MAG TPA: type I restriction-modification system subunit M N-terminal domain-containing protein, partial [Microbacterium sp.]|nr:type I restriction-modification system subunit M N-terminal domain-containing protein [Microbacterium sp.]
MITGELKSKIDAVWNAFWSGGVANPLTVIEQITYLIFLRRLDQLQSLAEAKAKRTDKPIERRIFTDEESDLRWNQLKNTDPTTMYQTVSERVFPFLRGLAAGGTTYGHQMKDATFMIPTPALLAKVVDLLDSIDLSNRDTNGDLY